MNRDYKNSRERILEGAAIAFSRSGFHGTSLREISKECGLEQPSIYHHFHSKENLFRKTLIATHLLVLNEIRRRVIRDQGLYVEVVSIFKAVAETAKIYPDKTRLPFSLIYSAPVNLQNEYTERYGNQYRKLLEAAFERSDRIGRKEEKLSLCVDLLYSLILACSVEVLYLDRVSGLEDRVRLILEL
ncbi:transcriptional regulator, TetR family [Leptospira weilii str. 2006001853]|uniref:Transcriptional regulator, TetR family n=4 Tax=Leptospira weilii TaxID=28184 RepID=A0A828YVP0_9LEPT|nr:transcriptional regulator, TetR family [Leptospira weilii str. 2006001853]EMJ66176.1 transcriptional regulator, TetR family [Leptospira sp. P2653]EMM72648.1 transcriptional regulator, TetR family [Leptospira weilii str. 2006001855]EMN43799.1 transcriptional regulator, TetR family [Leptospira weilii str. LNT 1234]EMN91648.1 transcriptional regulator, TetR family [Leptospira weilii str. UI 13098]EMY12188.1 transcriptional regulator, TetR family [Leptospira weilii str. Ecochallenge]